MNYNYKEMIENRVKYAADSYSIVLMYEIYGVLRGLALAGAVDNAYYVEASGRICRDYFNNATWRKECYRRAEI